MVVKADMMLQGQDTQCHTHRLNTSARKVIELMKMRKKLYVARTRAFKDTQTIV